jgi:hypothetical protein
VRSAIVAVALALGIFAPAVAEAGHHCAEVSPVVGLERCRRFGWWSHAGSMSFEAGAVAMRFDTGPIDSDAYVRGTSQHYDVIGSGRRVSATGGRIRETLSLGRYFHLGGEADLAQMLDGPSLVLVDPTARDDAASTATGSRGSIAVAKTLVGAHVAAGRFTLAGELAPGIAITNYTLASLPDATGTAQLWLVLEAHARAELWLTPQLTIAGDAGLDLVHPDNVTFGVTVGIHLMPFDRSR